MGLLGALSLRNRRVSVYWLWLVLVFGVTTFVPFWRSALTGSLLPLGAAYSNPQSFPWKPALFWHTLAAVAVAVGVATVHELWQLRSKAESVACVYSLRTVLLTTGVLALAFGLLRWQEAPAIGYLVVLMIVGGRFLTLLLVSALGRVFGFRAELRNGDAQTSTSDP